MHDAEWRSGSASSIVKRQRSIGIHRCTLPKMEIGINNDDSEDEVSPRLSGVDDVNNFKAKLRTTMANSSSLNVIIPSISIALSYLGTYVAKYPLFLLEHDDILLNIPLKDWLSYAFTIGFFVGKWPAYKYVPSITRSQRPRVLIVLFIGASFCLTGLLPYQGPYSAPLKIISVLIGSIFCSAIFGVEFTYLEGRSNGDVFIAAVNTVVFFGSSLCRAIGAALIRGGVPGRWMPILAVTLYSPITILSLYCLDAMPNPTEADIASMGERTIMASSEKSAFISNHAFGLTPLLLGFAFAAGFRFLRDFFALEIYREVLDREPEPLDYLLADWIGGAFCIASLLAMSRVTDNVRVLMLLLCMFAGGGLIIGLATFLFQREWISPELWIISIGVGLTCTITPFSGSLFDRIMACTRTKGTATFLINFGDAVAYVGVFLSLAYKTFSDGTSYEALFLTGCRVFTLILLITGALSTMYWSRVAKIAQYDSVEVDSDTNSNSSNSIEIAFERRFDSETYQK